MCHAALETYLYGDGHETRELEVDGYLWGYRRKDEDGYMIFVDRISPSFSSKKHQNWVVPNQRAAKVLAEFVDRWALEVTLLGDFHSHPYPNLATVNRNKGYYFSDEDFKSLESDDYFWDKTENLPLMVVMTVCKLERVHQKTDCNCISDNLWSWDVGEFRFWLNAAVGHIEDGKKVNTGNTHSKVFLDLNTRFFNHSVMRLNPEQGDPLRLNRFA